MADRYAVATGNWNDTGTWSESSGGAPGASVPTAADHVIFDANSGSITVTVANAGDACRSIDASAFTGTLALSQSLLIGDSTQGHCTFGASMTISPTSFRTLDFVSTATGNQITTNGCDLKQIKFNGSGGSWLLQDDLTATGPGTFAIALWLGTFDVNDQNITAKDFNMTTSGVRVVNLGTGMITLTTTGTAWNISNNSNLTINAETSTIRLTGSGADFFGQAHTYYTVQIWEANGTQLIAGTPTFENLTIKGSSTNISETQLAGDITVSGTLTIQGQGLDTTTKLESNNRGTARTITCNGTVSMTNAHLEDITGAGTASWDVSGSYVGDAGGNSSITFASPRTLYWVGNGGQWDDSSHWATSSGGAGGQNPPLPQDNAVFDANSFSSSSQNVNLDSPYACHDLTITGVTNSPDFTVQTAQVNVLGSVSLDSGIDEFKGAGTALFFYGRGIETLTSNGKKFTVGIRVDMITGTLSLVDDVDIAGFATSSFVVNSGTFDANDQNIKSVDFDINIATVNMGNGTWTIAGVSGTEFDAHSSSTINAEGSTIVVDLTTTSSVTFNGNGKTFNNIHIVDTNTGFFRINGSNTFNTFVQDPGTDVRFGSSTNTTIASLEVNGGSTSHANQQSISGTYTLTVAAVVNVFYLDLANCTAAGDAAPIDNQGGTDNGGNTNWNFVAPPPDIKTVNGLARASVKTIDALASASIKTRLGLNA